MASRGRIRSLEIENFKSFGGKNVIAFRGFTSVVGPNGAGKSNLMDAVSFVLGIHSRHLRSSKLIELLHKAPARRGLAATVALTYERPSGPDRRRRVARASKGELTAPSRSPSEDFKAEYDTLKAAKDAAEEASIVAFRSKKGLAAQRRAVKGQRDEADKYAGLDRELGRAKVDSFLWQIRHARDRMAEKGAAVAAAGEDLAAAEAAEADAARRAAERTRGAQAAQKRSRRRGEARGLAERAARRRRAPGRRAPSPPRRTSAPTRRADDAKKAASRDATRVAALAADASAVDGEVAALAAQLAERGAPGADRPRSPRSRARRRAERETAPGAFALEVARRARDADAEDLADLERRLGDLEAKKRTPRPAAGADARRRARRRGRRPGTDAARADRDAAKREAARLATAEATLEATRRGGERAARRKYNVAVPVAAGKFNEAIVVETRQCAVDCIRYLRDARLGSALFLPLDGIDPPRADERLRSLGPGYHLAVDVVQCDAAVAKAVAYAVGATVVCDDLDGARRLCYGPDADGRPPVKAVTLKGAQIAKSGTITGGAYGSGAPGLSDRAPGKAWRASDAVALEAKATEAAAAARTRRARGSRGEAPRAPRRGGQARGDGQNEAPGAAPYATGVAEADAVDASRLDGDDDGDAGRHEDRQRARWARCEALQRELDALAPNMKAGDQFDDVSDKLRVADGALNRSRDAARDAAAAFERVKKDRRDAFLACFDVVSKALASFYADITKSLRHPNGGAASLHVLDADEPYLGGVSFHATPPSKRFCEISQLSGGERTLASLALLFAVHGYHPAPFRVEIKSSTRLQCARMRPLRRNLF
ncbi:hypothetical protein JL721_2128 [Aureococcus anophagefferens]|nr:hypothetical protein JL721_2128 [Aureococcus anophagefferens]